jgi:hypothetical protein
LSSTPYFHNSCMDQGRRSSQAGRKAKARLPLRSSSKTYDSTICVCAPFTWRSNSQRPSNSKPKSRYALSVVKEHASSMSRTICHRTGVGTSQVQDEVFYLLLASLVRNSRSFDLCSRRWSSRIYSIRSMTSLDPTDVYMEKASPLSTRHGSCKIAEGRKRAV